MLFYSVLNVVREGLCMQVVFACWKQIRFLLSFLSNCLFLFSSTAVSFFPPSSLSPCPLQVFEHLWKCLSPSTFYSQENIFQDIIENNWNKSQQYKMLSDWISTSILLMSWDITEMSETMKDIGRLCMWQCTHHNELSKKKQCGIQMCSITDFYLYFTSILFAVKQVYICEHPKVLKVEMYAKIKKATSVTKGYCHWSRLMFKSSICSGLRNQPKEIMV